MSATPTATVGVSGKPATVTLSVASPRPALSPAIVGALSEAAADTSTRFGVAAASAVLLNQIAEHQQHSAGHLAAMADAFSDSTTKLSASVVVEEATIDAYSTALSNQLSTAINTLVQTRFEQLNGDVKSICQRLDSLEKSEKKNRDDIEFARATIMSDERETRATREYEHFRIAALEKVTEANWSHLENLGQMVDAAIRQARLEELLRHIQQWDESLAKAPDKKPTQKVETAPPKKARNQSSGTKSKG